MQSTPAVGLQATAAAAAATAAAATAAVQPQVLRPVVLHQNSLLWYRCLLLLWGKAGEHWRDSRPRRLRLRTLFRGSANRLRGWSGYWRRSRWIMHTSISYRNDLIRILAAPATGGDQDVDRVIINQRKYMPVGCYHLSFIQLVESTACSGEVSTCKNPLTKNKIQSWATLSCLATRIVRVFILVQWHSHFGQPWTPCSPPQCGVAAASESESQIFG